MKEFVEKLIGRLEEIRQMHADLSQSDSLTEEEQIVQSRFCGCFSKAKAIVNQLAEEYNNGWIPLREVPKKRRTKGKESENDQLCINAGWNHCIDEILKEGAI